MNTLNIDIRSEDYFYQRPHMNFLNKIFYSDFMKKYNPFHEHRSYHPLERQRAAYWYGYAPQQTWIDGIIDYTYNKHNVNTIGHFHMHENRKNKPFKSHSGADATKRLLKYPTYVPIYLPRGCFREVKNYQECRKQGGNCVEQKVSIVEVCPKWALELLREKKRLMMKATVIDNATYRRAMRVEEYNKDRSLRDLKDKYAHLKELRGDGYWADDRYNPTVYPSADSATNINLGDSIIYLDVLGGNRVETIQNNRKRFMNSSYESVKAQLENTLDMGKTNSE